MFSTMKGWIAIGALALVIGVGASALVKINKLNDALTDEQTAHQKTTGDLITRTTERDNAIAAGKLCTASVEAMRTKASEAAATAKPAVEQAKVKQTQHAERAQVILRTPATAPDDMCTSVNDRAARWQKEKAQK